MSVRVLIGDCRDVLKTLPAASVQCCVTSPPYYGLRDYGHENQIGLEQSPDDYVSAMIQVFGSVRRVLKDNGTLWLNIGDSYSVSGLRSSGASMKSTLATRPTSTKTAAQREIGAWKCGGRGDAKSKDLLGIPWLLAFALRADGWYLRSDIIWHKPNPMPESVTDRPTSAHEHVFLFAKRERYFYDSDAIREPHERLWDGSNNGGSLCGTDGRDKAVIGGHGRGERAPSEPNPLGRNARNVWTIASQPFSGAHFATMPPDLAERCIKAGSKLGDTVLDPFGGAGTTAVSADRLNRNAIIIELNADYAAIADNRVRDDADLFAEVSGA